jgi:DNA mismatch repair protein MutL
MKSDLQQSMIYTTASSQWAQMEALLSPPGVERSAVKDMYVFVNGRLIKDKSLRFATLRGYHSHLLRGRYPVSVIFLTMDSGLVDANVHPAKTEVRLQYANEIHSMMATAIRDALRKGAWASPQQTTAALVSDGRDDAAYQARKDSYKFDVDAGPNLRGQSTAVWREVTPHFNRPVANKAGRDEASANRDFGFDLISQFDSKTEATAVDAINWDELDFMGSIADCYLLFKHGERATGARLLVVDQHAFHERVIYERLLKDQNLLKASQPLLVPECVRLGPKAVSALESIKPQLTDNGFSLEIIDDSHVELRAVPILLAKADISELLETIAEQLMLLPIDSNVGLLHDLLSTFACHSAVRAGERLGSDELKVLIKEAKSVDFYHNCPHGRRVFRWWDEAQIARWFDR